MKPPWTHLSMPDRRALLVGALVLGSALALRVVVKPYLHSRAALAERLREQERLLERELGLVQSAALVVGSMAETTRRFDRVRSRLLEARGPLGATAALVGELGDDARRHGVLIEAIESRPPEVLGHDLTAVEVDVRGRGDLEGVLRWLHGMESGNRLLRVEQLSLARLEGGATTDSLDTETLAFAMNIRGFTITHASSPASRTLATTTRVAP